MGNKRLKLGMSILNSHPEKLSIENQIELFAEIGFHSIFLSSGVTQDFSKIPKNQAYAPPNIISVVFN